jgi:hypothetical protein
MPWARPQSRSNRTETGWVLDNRSTASYRRWWDLKHWCYVHLTCLERRIFSGLLVAAPKRSMCLCSVSSLLDRSDTSKSENTQKPSPSNQYSNHSGLKSFVNADNSWVHSSLACFVRATRSLAWYITEATALSKLSPSETRMTAFSSERPSFRAYRVRVCTSVCNMCLHEHEVSHQIRSEILVRLDWHH